MTIAHGVDREGASIGSKAAVLGDAGQTPAS